MAQQKHDGPDDAHRRPDGVTNDTVAALGKFSEALEAVEHARGLLYGFHRLTGTADLALGETTELLRDAGHNELAERIDRELVGRNVIQGRWTFQIVEDYDDNYYATFCELELERDTRTTLAQGRRHLLEAEMKEDRRTHHRPHHEALPNDDARSSYGPSSQRGRRRRRPSRASRGMWSPPSQLAP